MEAIEGDPEKVALKKGWRNMITSCEHTDAPHYGKGFCRRCYMVSVLLPACPVAVSHDDFFFGGGERGYRF